MTGQVIVIGAGIIGMCAANYLQRSGLKVTVLDAVAPGRSCSFGNAGALSSGSCVPSAMPGVLRQLPKWLTDDMGPLVVAGDIYRARFPGSGSSRRPGDRM